MFDMKLISWSLDRVICYLKNVFWKVLEGITKADKIEVYANIKDIDQYVRKSMTSL